MKVGILTYHNNENKGAILQAYGLWKTIQETTQCERVEIVDYRTLSKEITRVRPLFLTKTPSTIPTRLRDLVLCEQFIRNSMSTNGKRIITNDHEKAIRKIEALGYDVLIVGSDEVWKIRTRDDRLRRLLSPSRPFPSPYFLAPSLSATKMSYAASANTTRFDTLSEDQIETLIEHLSAFDHVSVRDNYTERSLIELGIEPVYRVPDPTLLAKLPSMDATDVLIRNGIDPDRPILGLHTHRSPLFKEVADRYRSRGFQIVSPTQSPYADINLKSRVNPFEYYSLYDQFDMVVTSSLHSTIFSLKHYTPFVTVDVSSKYRAHESKTCSLLKDFSMLGRYYNAVENSGRDLVDELPKYEKPVDERHVSERIDSLRADGLDFLSKTKVYQDGN